MKLSELTENDVIHIRTKKEAKRIAKLCNEENWFNPALKKNGSKTVIKAFNVYGKVTVIWKNIAIGYNNEIYPSYSDVAYAESTTQKRNIIPASRFLQNTNLDISDFSGVIVATKEGSVYSVGHKSNRWLKKDFTLCTEPVTISN